MTIDEKKVYLMMYKKCHLKLKSLEAQKQELIETMVSAKAQNYDDMPKSGKQTDLSDLMVQLERITRKIDAKRITLLKIKLGIEESILSMDNGTESEVLRRRYIQMESWDKIAEGLGYYVRHIYRIHGNALQNFEPKMALNDSINV